MKVREHMNMRRTIVITTTATLLGLLAGCFSSSAPSLPSQAQVTAELKTRVAGLFDAMPTGTTFEVEGNAYDTVPCDDNPPANDAPVSVSAGFYIVNTRTPAPAQTYIDLAVKHWQGLGWKTGPGISGSGMSGVDAQGYRFTVQPVAGDRTVITAVAPCATPTPFVPPTS